MNVYSKLFAFLLITTTVSTYSMFTVKHISAREVQALKAGYVAKRVEFEQRMFCERADIARATREAKNAFEATWADREESKEWIILGAERNKELVCCLAARSVLSSTEVWPLSFEGNMVMVSEIAGDTNHGAVLLKAVPRFFYDGVSFEGKPKISISKLVNKRCVEPEDQEAYFNNYGSTEEYQEGCGTSMAVTVINPKDIKE